MGHSAGAHLVALVTADPTLLRDAGARPVLGTVALDQGALDVPASMTRKHFKLYDDAFGQDPAFWTRVSPLHQMRRAGRLATPVMAACSSERLDPCPQAREFAAAARTLRGRVEVLPLALQHQAINDQLGLPGAYTDAVTAFLRSVGGIP
jgi:acetyl esterase/lipase